MYPPPHMHACMHIRRQVRQQPAEILKVLYIVTLCSKYTRALTFQNLCQADSTLTGVVRV